MLDGHGSRRPLRGLLTMRFFIFVPPKIYLILRSTAGRQPGRASRPACAKPKRLRFGGGRRTHSAVQHRSEEHTSELQSLMRISYAVFCLKKKTQNTNNTN